MEGVYELPLPFEVARLAYRIDQGRDTSRKAGLVVLCCQSRPSPTRIVPGQVRSRMGNHRWAASGQIGVNS